MPYTTTQLVTSSFYLANILARDDQVISGSQLQEGVNLLNEFISIKTANQSLIPYFSEYDFLSVISQKKYFIPRAVLLETLTYEIGGVRYATTPIGRISFQGNARVNNIDSLAYEWHFERCKGGANIFIYFGQGGVYPMKVWGKFSLAEVILNEDLSLIYDGYYIAYFRYGLAEILCEQYGASFKPSSKQKLEELEQILCQISPLDMSVNKTSFMGSKSGINYGQVNIGKGWI